MNEAGGYGGIWFTYKKEVDKRSVARRCVLPPRRVLL